MKIIFLGTGTSTGVPQLRCDCAVCISSDHRDKRMRTSAVVECGNGVNLLIDCGPDFYHQMLTMPRLYHLSALLITHVHYDHVGGMDDLRPYCRYCDFPIYCKADVRRALFERMPYAFANIYPGVPHFDFHDIRPLEPFTVEGVEVLPLPVNHYKLEIVGYRIGNLAYITDAKKVYDETIDAIQGIDTLVINALRREEHISHLSLSEALEIIGRINPRRAYLTHISHDMPPAAKASKLLPPNVYLAYDGLEVHIP